MIEIDYISMILGMLVMILLFVISKIVEKLFIKKPTLVTMQNKIYNALNYNREAHRNLQEIYDILKEWESKT